MTAPPAAQHVQTAVDLFAVGGGSELNVLVLTSLRAAIGAGVAAGVSRGEAERIVADEFLERLRLREDISARQLSEAARELAELFPGRPK
jgi:hypothetical protein